MTRLTRRRDERGAVLVFVALVLPVALLLTSLAVDIGNSWWHQRHLQVQADAAATAVAEDFGPACTNATISADAAQYGGTAASPYNGQIGGTASTNVHELINSPTFYNQNGASDPVDTTVNTNPNWCASMMADVKMTETNLPWYFKAFSVPFINAHARVQINQETQASGMLPIGVNENMPKAARAYFINEDTGAVLANVPLNDQGPNGQGQEMWNNATAPAQVLINAPHIGVRVALSGDPNNTACPETSQLVTCLDSNANNATLIHIQGYSTLGNGSVTNSAITALARSVTLAPGTCSDGYFSSTATNCNVGISANVDLGSTPNPAGVSVAAVVGGGTPSPLTYDASTGLWTGTAPVIAASGPNQVNLQIACDNKADKSVCSGSNKTLQQTLADVQQTYSAVNNPSGSGFNSGSIQSASISEGGVSGADSFPTCSTCQHSLVVSITTSGTLASAQQFSDPTYVMRFGGGTSSSQTGAIACNGQGKFATALQTGCNSTYAVNPLKPGWACPDTASPADCVPADTGLATGQLRSGLTARITTPPKGKTYYCLAGSGNNWVNNNGSGVPNIPADDSRIVHVFVTSYGSFGGTGQQSYPIQTFATFYVTWWDGDPCNSDPGPPPNQKNSAKDQIWGHFISYIDYQNQGGGTQPCNPNGLGACVPVMTR
jgi:hypothetical protein